MNSLIDIIGHKRIIDNLRNAAISGHVNHAYLFSGEIGLGKMMIANGFAKLLNCINPKTEHEADSCGICEACIQSNSENNPDIIYIYPTKTKSIGVDDVREQINKTVYTKPYKNKYKVYIIKNAELMTVAAQNALLKTLEEPPVYGIFLLTSENPKMLLPTILSRTALYTLKPLANAEVENYLMHTKNIERNKAAFVALYSMGSIGAAVKYAEDENFSTIREKVINILDGLQRLDLYDAIFLAKEFEQMKESIIDILNIAQLWYRDIAVLKEIGNESLVFQKDILDKLHRNTDMSITKVYNSIDSIINTKYNLKYNANFTLSLEALLMDLNEKI